MKKLLLILTTLLVCSSTLLAQHGKYVGGDISILPLYEQHNKPYLDKSGNQIDNLMTWLMSECGWNTFRVRLFVDPKGKHPDGSTDPSVCQDLEYVKTLGRRIKEAGAYFMLDFHYSDTWVDASHIQAPDAWKSLTVDQKAVKISEYTHEVLQALKEAGAKPDQVQVGNEIMYGFVGIKVAPYDKSDSDWTGYLKVLKAAAEAVRAECPEAEIIVHTDRPTNSDYIKYYYNKLDAAAVPYDVIGLSYYPFWHGTLTSLANSLGKVKTDFPTKKVQIVETAYYFQYWPSQGINYNTQSTWAATADGQYKFVKDLINTLSSYEQVEGLSYWCPEEAGNGDDTDWNTSSGTVLTTWLNRGLWWPSLGADNKGHWPITSNGEYAARLMKGFLGAEASLGSTPALSPDAPIYNILGQRVSHVERGQIYIQNGRKFIQR